MREVRVFIQPEQLQATGVTVAEVMQALQQQNLELPGGSLKDNNEEFLVRVTGRIEEPEQFGDVIVANRGGQPIRLSDVARVVDAGEEESTAFVNDSRAIGLDVVKVSDANTVEVAEAVKEGVGEIQQSLGAGRDLQVVRDNSTSIRRAVEDSIFELIFGAILIVAVVMLFMAGLHRA